MPFRLSALDSITCQGTWYEGVTLDQPYSYQEMRIRRGVERAVKAGALWAREAFGRSRRDICWTIPARTCKHTVRILNHTAATPCGHCRAGPGRESRMNFHAITPLPEPIPRPVPPEPCTRRRPRRNERESCRRRGSCDARSRWSTCASGSLRAGPSV